MNLSNYKSLGINTNFEETSLSEEQRLLKKTTLILEAIEKNWSSLFIYADPGHYIHRKINGELEFQMQDKDMCCMKALDKTISSSFMVIKANPQTRSLFTRILKAFKSSDGLHSLLMQGGLEALINLFHSNYCRINLLDTNFAEDEIPMLIKNFCALSLSTKFNEQAKEQNILHLKKILQKESEMSTEQNSIRTLSMLNQQTFQLSTYSAEATENLRQHLNRVSGTIDLSQIQNLDQALELKKTIAIAINHPDHLNSKRFKTAEESRVNIECDSIKFHNIIPEKNASHIDPSTDKPFLKDILNKLAETTDSEWIGYANADTIFRENFKKIISFIMSKQYTSISCMADSVKTEKDKTLKQILSMEPDVRTRGGRDLFMIKKRTWEDIKNKVPNYIIGEPDWDIGLVRILQEHKEPTIDLYSPTVITQELHKANWSSDSILAKHNSTQSQLYGIDIHATFQNLKTWVQL